MLQKISTVPALGAVLFVLTACLIMQKPYLGISLNQAQNLTLRLNDPSSTELFEANQAQVSNTSPAEPEKELLVAKAEPKVEAITIEKPKNTPAAPADIEGMIRRYANEYNANPEIMIRIAKCESGFNASAVSPSGAYRGLYQFVTSTWQSNRRAMGLSDDPALMFDAEEAIKTAAFKMGRDGYGAWPVCSQKAIASL